MQNNFEYYIVVHNPAIIEFFEKAEKYKTLKNYKYLLVKNYKTDFSNDHIIQCNKQANNIEHCNHCTAYTAWFAAAANNLVSRNSKYVCFLEYDTDLRDIEKFAEMEKNVLNGDKDVVGFFPLGIEHDFLTKTIFSEKLLDYLKQNNIRQIVPNNNFWSTTNNFYFKSDFFYKFMLDPFTLKFMNFLNNDKMSGHNLERYLTAYCFINNIEFSFINPVCFVHKALDSHNTQGRAHEYEKFKTLNQISD
jgi:hypothetical protein